MTKDKSLFTYVITIPVIGKNSAGKVSALLLPCLEPNPHLKDKLKL